MPANRTLVIRDADLVVTLDDTRRELAGASLLVRGPQIEAIWPAGQRPPGLHADEVINARGPPPDRLVALSTAGCWCAKASSPASTWARWCSATTGWPARWCGATPEMPAVGSGSSAGRQLLPPHDF